MAPRDTFGGLHGLLFWVLSVIIAWRGGFGPVVLASTVAVIFRDFVLTSPSPHRGGSAIEVFSIINYLGVSATLGYTVDTLRRARRRVALATDGMIDAMLVFDRRWRLRFYNKAGHALLNRVGVRARHAKRRVVWDTLPAWIGTPFEAETSGAQIESASWSTRRNFPRRLLVPGSLRTICRWRRVDVRSRCHREAERGDRTSSHGRSISRPRGSEHRAGVERLSGRCDQQHASVARAYGSNDDRAARHWLAGRHPSRRPCAGRRPVGRRGEGRAAIHSGVSHSPSRRPVSLVSRARSARARERRIVEWVGVLDDIHEEHLARERHRAVENALGVLGVSLDYEWNLAAVTRMLVPTLADYCSIDLVDAEGELRRVSTTHVDPEKEVVLRELWQEYPYHADDPGTPAVVRTGKPQLMPVIDPQETARFTRSAEQAAMFEQLSPRSYLCVPMSSRGQVFGALALVYSDSGRTYGPAELAAVEQIAARAATAIENARLYADAQAANRTKSDFLATMSHELRTPLNAIAGYAELLLMGVRGSISDDQRRDLVRIRQNQQHLLEIITDILNFSRIEAGRTRYNLQPLRVAEVLERMEGVIEPQAHARSLQYEYIAPDSVLTATGDREKLEQVLINLLGNAVKFTPPGGRITLTANADERIRQHPGPRYRRRHREGTARVDLRALRATRASAHADGGRHGPRAGDQSRAHSRHGRRAARRKPARQRIRVHRRTAARVEALHCIAAESSRDAPCRRAYGRSH